MAYDAHAKQLVVKVIGTVESDLTYGAINYNDPITVGIAQWYGVRAAAILCRMRDENPSTWNGVAGSIAGDLATIASDNHWWDSRGLTRTEGDSLRPVLEANRAIQEDQCVLDMEVYKDVAIANGMDPEGNTDAVLFFFTMYHQGPLYAFQVLNAVGPNASLDQFHNGALANPVLGQYVTRYNTAYELIKSGDVSGMEPLPDSGNGEPPVDNMPELDPVPESTSLNLSHISIAGQSLIVHLEDEQLLCYPTGNGLWLPSRTLEIVEPPPVVVPEPETPAPGTPGPVTPPGGGGGGIVTPSGKWVHPLPGAILTSPYGPRSFDGLHAGVDLSTTSAPSGGDVLAPVDMRITQAWEAYTGGLAAAGTFVKGISLSGEAYTFSFFHGVPGSLSVSAGDEVGAGTKLMVEGASGNVTGTHLHLEMWPGHVLGGFAVDSPWYYGDGTPINPQPIFAANGIVF